MRRGLIGIILGLGLVWTTPVGAHGTKRTDPCGCHHQWGLRHCHPKKKTVRCEAPASDEQTEADKKARKLRYKNPQHVEM